MREYYYSHQNKLFSVFKKKATRDIVFVSLTGWVGDTLLSFVAFIVLSFIDLCV